MYEKNFENTWDKLLENFGKNLGNFWIMVKKFYKEIFLKHCRNSWRKMFITLGIGFNQILQKICGNF